jgi:hypothetical protein
VVRCAGERHVHRLGPIATWRAPRQQTTPDLYTLKLLITEKYTSAGQPKENSVSSTVQVHYNDSPKEIMTISMRFLTELFPTYTIPPQQAVADFSDSCSEKAVRVQRRGEQPEQFSDPVGHLHERLGDAKLPTGRSRTSAAPVYSRTSRRSEEPKRRQD